ncbi:ParB/RepB/Spo0J family partition protein [Micromonospora sp. STR1s_5]|nr:ParB/RepB/Spo0J family partition protein [Micromonospora sp. STR1s_5]
MSKPTPIPALMRIPTALVKPGRNARKHLGDVEELAMSIKEGGQEEPITVHDCGNGTYEVHEGHRRLAAIQLIKYPYVLAVLRRRFDDAERLTKQVKIHAQRQAFDPMDEALAFHELMFKHNHSREKIAREIGKRPEYVRDRIALTRLTPEEQDLVRRGRLPVGEAVLRVADRRAELIGQARPARRRTTRPFQKQAGTTPGNTKPATTKQTFAPAAATGGTSAVPVIALCGAARFAPAYEAAAREFTLAGHPVLTPTFLDDAAITTRQMEVLRAVHRRMIALADEVLVINPDGYIGDGTAEDIAYAEELGKLVRFLVPVDVAAAA